MSGKGAKVMVAGMVFTRTADLFWAREDGSLVSPEMQRLLDRIQVLESTVSRANGEANRYARDLVDALNTVAHLRAAGGAQSNDQQAHDAQGAR